MSKFPVDAPKREVIRALEHLGFRLLRGKGHIATERSNSDGTKTPLTIPNHPKIKSSTLRTIYAQEGILRDDFLDAYERNS